MCVVDVVILAKKFMKNNVNRKESCQNGKKKYWKKIIKSV